jgi:aminoglycoside phosphotransferase (APT) family kinase protein
LPEAGASTVAGSAFEAYLDALMPAGEPARLTRIGEGASNLTYLVERGGARLVLRRPPPPPLPPSAHDVVREARLQIALRDQGVPVPRVLDVCEDPTVIGQPFYLMEELRGSVLTDTAPPATDGRVLGAAFADALATLHAVDWQREPLSGFGRPSGYLERQLRRFGALYDAGEGRRFPAFEALTEALAARVPQASETAIVHGDYRLGNVMVGPGSRLEAVLDWEMATIGDPLADVGYMTITWSEPGAEPHCMLRSPVTGAPGFPTRAELVEQYAASAGRDVSALPWYQALALWKASVFCEAIYQRSLRGEHDDPWAESLCDGVPRLIEVGALCLAQA